MAVAVADPAPANGRAGLYVVTGLPAMGATRYVGAVARRMRARAAIGTGHHLSSV